MPKVQYFSLIFCLTQILINISARVCVSVRVCLRAGVYKLLYICLVKIMEVLASAAQTQCRDLALL